MKFSHIQAFINPKFFGRTFLLSIFFDTQLFERKLLWAYNFLIKICCTNNILFGLTFFLDHIFFYQLFFTCIFLTYQIFLCSFFLVFLYFMIPPKYKNKKSTIFMLRIKVNQNKLIKLKIQGNLSNFAKLHQSPTYLPTYPPTFLPTYLPI